MVKCAVLGWFTQKTPLEHAKRDLEDAEHDLLTASACAEHYAAVEVMLQSRIERLRTAITTLTPKE